MEIEKAFKKLLIRHPFYGLFCLSLPKKVNPSISTLQVSRQGINCCLEINPEFWNQHTDEEQIALLLHELGHIALQHMFLYDSFPDHQLFNLAADAEVNSYIENLPDSAVTPTALTQKFGIQCTAGMGTKKYYELLTQPIQQQQAQNPQKPCNGGKGGQSQDSQPQNSSQQSTPKNTNNTSNPEEATVDSPSGESSKESPESSQYPSPAESDFNHIDDHDSWKQFTNIPEANQQLIMNNVHAILRQTADQVEKMRGTIPGELTEIIQKLREKKPEVFNWKAYFRRLLGSIYDVNIKTTRRKESKRFQGAAGIQHRKKVSMLVAIDTSCSVSVSELQEFFSEIDYVYKAGARITLIECDSEINSITEYDGKTLPEIKGRGGTAFDPPVNYYKKHKKEYASLIYFTDGEAPMPQHRPSGMIWVISSRGRQYDYPGKTIYIPKQQ